MSTQKSTRKKFTSLLATATAALVAVGGMALAPSAAFADVEVPRAVTSGNLTWGISADINSPNMGRPNPLPGNYVAPATFDSETRLSSWGEATGELNADGSAALSFNGTSVNFAKTGGGWLKLADLQVELDAAGNGVVSAEVAYGTAPGEFPAIVFDPMQAPDRGSERIDIVALENNDTHVTIDGESATWSGLSGVWTAEFADFVAGDVNAEPAIPEWTYAAYLSNATDARKPSTFAFDVNLEPGIVVPKVQAAVTRADSKGLGVTASFTGATGMTISPTQGMPGPSVGVYAAVFEVGTSGEATLENQGIASAWVKNAAISDGAGSATLNLPVKGLNRTKKYEVLFWYAHSTPSPETTIGVTPLVVTNAQWDAVFKKDEPVKIPFTDVKQGQKFYNEIAWMYTAKVTTGVKQPDGSVKYMPKANVTREAMAAFLFRQYGDKNYQAPKTSKFTDVKYGDKFYKEIAWMDSKGYSTGVKQANGSVKYMPKANVTREAMAAFIYRIEKGAGTGKSVVFNDVKPGQKFFKEINWMSGTGITTGIKQSNGTYNYAPKANVTREAMAAFLYRADKL